MRRAVCPSRGCPIDRASSWSQPGTSRCLSGSKVRTVPFFLMRLTNRVEPLSLLATRIKVAAGSGFLRYMVRNLVGTLIEVGLGRREASNVAEVLESLDRALGGRTAPAQGLTLVRVDY